jgi:hypothetical protein
LANTSRFAITENDLSGPVETMRLRQMLDLDQSGQKFDNITLTDLIWTDEELFGDEWFDFSARNEENDFWSEVLEENLLTLK